MTIDRIIVGELEANCYLLGSKDDLIVVDPGSDPEKIFAAAAKRAGNIKFIILTHGHPDHIGACAAVREATGAELVCHEDEVRIIGEKADRLVKEGDRILFGDCALEILHTPGHTPGGICLKTGNTILTGDTLFLNGHGRTDLEWGDEEAMERSLERLDRIIKPGMAVYPGHGDYTFV